WAALPTCSTWRRVSRVVAPGVTWRRVKRVVATAVRVLLINFRFKPTIYLLNPPIQWLVVLLVPCPLFPVTYPPLLR
ncbi:hypothetical protein, partial [Chlorogloeopsis fritschii]